MPGSLAMLEAKKKKKTINYRLKRCWEMKRLSVMSREKRIYFLELKLSILFQLLFSLSKLLVRLMKAAVAVYGAQRMNPTDYGVKSSNFPSSEP